MAGKPNLSEEMKKMEYEPLLPAEKKLIVYNLLIGSALLVLLVWVSHTFFPITRMEAGPAGQAVVQGAPSAQGQAQAAPVANTTPVPQGK